MNVSLKKFFFSSRFLSIKKNLTISFMLKFFSLFYLFAIPKIILLNFDTKIYGLFLTVISISMFFELLDFGLGTNLRNNIVKLNILKNKKPLKKYISTTYFLIIFISLFSIIAFIFIKDYLNWSYFFNEKDYQKYNINYLINFFIIYSILSISLRNLNQIFFSIHSSYFVDLIDLLAKSTFFFLLILSYFEKFEINFNFLFYYYIFSYVFINLVSNVIFFIKFKLYRPEIKFISLTKINKYFYNSFQFFILQIGAIIFFYSDRIMISKNFSSSEVTNFFITGQIYFVLFAIFNLLTIPFWSSYTDAYFKKDIKWIKNSIYFQLIIFFIFIIIGYLIFIFSDQIINIWIGNDFSFNFTLSFSWYVLILLKCLSLIFVNFLNAINELKSQIVISIIIIFFNIPLSLFFALNLNFGSAGILYGSISCVILAIIVQISMYIHRIKIN